MGPEELAASAMQIMTSLFLDQAATEIGDGTTKETTSHQAAQQVLDNVRELLRRTDSGIRAFNEFVKHPHSPLRRDKLRTTLAQALSDDDRKRRLADCVAAADRAREQGWRKETVITAALLVILGVVLVAYSVYPFPAVDRIISKGSRLGLSAAWGPLYDLSIRVALTGAGAICLATACSILQRASMERSHLSARVDPVPAVAAQKLQKEAGRTGVVNAMQAKVFASAVLWPTDIRQRIVETYVPEGNMLRKRVRIEAQLPISDLRQDGGTQQSPQGKLPPDLKFVYFPVLIPPKGELQDNLDIYGDDGNALPVLAYREYLQLAAGALRLLLESKNGAPDRPDVREAELRALAEIAQRRLQAGRAVPGVDRDTSGSAELRKAIPQDSQAETAAAFAEKLREYYAVVAIVQPDEKGRFSVAYEQTTIPKENHKRMTEALGARPLNLRIDLENASTCQCYHLRVQCPDYLYLHHQRLEASVETLQRIQLDAPTLAHTRFQRRLGQAYAHFYTRYFPQNAPGQPTPKIKFTFYEVPPASLFRASVAAIVCFLLVWTVGLVISRRSDPGSDVPAFLLAFPAVAAALLGFDKQSRSLLDSTLRARLSLIMTALLSILASALFMACKALTETSGAVDEPVGGWIDWPKILSGNPVLGMTSWPWILLTSLAMLNALITTCSYAVQLTTFTYLRARNGTDATQRSDK